MLMRDFDYGLVRQFATWKCDFPHFTRHKNSPHPYPKEIATIDPS
jgi:hypothetical protein